jgi:hypothetical protein
MAESATVLFEPNAVDGHRVLRLVRQLASAERRESSSQAAGSGQTAGRMRARSREARSREGRV